MASARMSLKGPGATFGKLTDFGVFASRFVAVWLGNRSVVAVVTIPVPAATHRQVVSRVQRLGEYLNK